MRRKGELYLVLGILVLAAAVRVWGIGYGLPCTYCRPDEDRLIAVALRLGRPDLNPGYFVWPGLPFYLTRLILEAAALARPGLSGGSALGLYLADPGSLHLLLRSVFCLFGLATIYLLYRVGRELFSPAAGVLAAFFLALSFLHVRDSRFAMLDIPVTLIAVGFFLPAARIVRRGGRRDYLAAGLLLGLAAAVKYYGVVLAVPLVAAHLWRRCAAGPALPRRLAAALATAGLVFLIGSPYTVFAAAAALGEIGREIFSGQFVTGFPLLGEIATPRGWLYHPLFSLRWGLGWPLETAALLGTAYCGWRTFRGAGGERLVFSFILAFYLTLAFQRSCFIRYTTMLLPFLALAVAVLLERLFPERPGRRLLLAAVAILLMLEPAIRVVRLDLLLSRTDTRISAGRWMAGNIPAASFLIFPQPFLWTRPEGHQDFPNRVIVPPGPGDRMRGLLELDFPGEKWVVTGEHPLAYASLEPGIGKLLEARAVHVRSFPAFRESGRGAVFDPFDAFFVPLAGFSAVSAPGPEIRFYRCP